MQKNYYLAQTGCWLIKWVRKGGKKENAKTEARFYIPCRFLATPLTFRLILQQMSTCGK